MARADRLARTDEHRIELEAAYRVQLIDALRVTAAGRWGLFGHNKNPGDHRKAAPTIDALTEAGDTIDGMRAQLGLEPFPLHRQFLASRGPVPPSAPGEPKQALAWLARLEAPDPA
jgi:hypothetical protein